MELYIRQATPLRNDTLKHQPHRATSSTSGHDDDGGSGNDPFDPDVKVPDISSASYDENEVSLSSIVTLRLHL